MMHSRGKASSDRAAKRGRGRPQKPGRPRRAEVERHSLAAILNLLRSEGALTRQEVERRTALGRAVVADRISTLARLGLVKEDALARPRGGRAPRLVQFRSDAALLLVAALDLSKIGVGLADLSGKLLIEHHEAADLTAGPEAAMNRLQTLFDWVLEQHQEAREIWGIGIAAPGPVEGADLTDAVELRFLPNWTGYPLAQQLARRYRAPVVLRDGVQMRALGELRAGMGFGAGALLFVDLGREISASLISEGHLHRGAQNAAGMIGHIAVEEADSTVCRCGNTGCLELVAGAEAIRREAGRSAAEGNRYLAEALAANGELGAADVGLAAQRGDAFSAELLARCGRQIGTVLAALTNALNPSLILLGGEVAETGDILLAAIREAVYRRSHPLVSRDLRIIRSQMGNSAGLVGSALTLLDEFFSAGFLAGWINLGSPCRHPQIAQSIVRAESEPARSSRAPRPPADNNLLGGGAMA